MAMQRLLPLAAAAMMLATQPAAAESVILTEGLKAFPNTVKVESVTADKAGYVVVHEADQNGAAGEVLGLKAVEEGENAGLSIPLGRKMKAGSTLIVMLHEETDGDAKFGPEDKPVAAGREPVQQTVTVE
jgi:hypothetical protein